MLRRHTQARALCGGPQLIRTQDAVFWRPQERRKKHEDISKFLGQEQGNVTLAAVTVDVQAGSAGARRAVPLRYLAEQQARTKGSS